MRCRSLLVLGLAAGLVPTAASRFEGRAAPARAAEAAMVPGYGMVPLSFERNRGQADPRVRYLARGGGYSLFLTSSEAVLSLRAGEPDGREPLGPAPEARRE